MQRRKFIENTGMIAVGVGIFGNISWDKERFIGDTTTTTDILGPFYRPNAPIRTSINPLDYSGKLFHLSGTIFKEDGKTPFPGSMVEIWQADENKKYDNTSDEFLYRGSQKVGRNGKYHFITVHPIPYPVDEAGSFYRPAHIHMRISGEGQQDLITQIYFKDDPYLEKDPFAGSPQAVSRILKISENNRNEEMVEFNVVMQREFKPSPEVYQKLSGIYNMSDTSMMEFYKDGDMLFVKWNGQIIAGLSYKGNNTFGGGPNDLEAAFELQPGGLVKVKIDYARPVVATANHLEGVKTFKY